MIELQEPEWREVFEEECDRKPHFPRYLQEVDAFEATMSRWRKFHATPQPDGKHKPAAAVDAIIGLALQGVMAPRSTWRDLPRDGVIGYQHDDHMWLSIAGEQWRIMAIEDRMLHLERMAFDAQAPSTRQIDLTRAKWKEYITASCLVLEALRLSPEMP